MLFKFVTDTIFINRNSLYNIKNVFKYVTGTIFILFILTHSVILEIYLNVANE